MAISLKGGVFICLVGLFGFSRTGTANDGIFDIGYGAKSRGMGGAGIAFPQDSLAVAANPAGEAWVGNRLDLEAIYYRPLRGGFDPTAGAGYNFGGNGRENFVIGEGGITYDVNRIATVGLAVYHNGGVDSRYTNAMGFQNFAGPSEIGLDLQQIFLAPSLSLKISPHQAIGVAPIIAYETLNIFGYFDSNPGTDNTFGGGVRIGYIGKFFDRITVGATWQSEIWLGRLHKYGSTSPYGFNSLVDDGSLNIPSNFGGGIAFEATPQATVTIDLEEILYHTIPGINEFSSYVYEGFNWRDMTVIKVGASFDVTPQLTLRAGYNYCTAQMRKLQTDFDILAPAVVQHHVTGGMSWRPCNRLEITAFYMHGFQNNVVGMGNPAGSVNVHESEDSFGISLGWSF